MRTTALLLCILALSIAPILADEIVLQDFDFADDAAAQAAWVAGTDSDPVTLVDHDDGKAMRIPCPFTRDAERSMHDIAIDLDLSRYGRLSMDLYADDLAAFSHFSLYFRSGGGWYATQLRQEPGWHTVELVKSDFRIEGEPAGWGHIDGIRISGWKGDNVDSFILVDNLKAYSSEIAVVVSTLSRDRSPGEARSIESIAQQVGQLLNDSGLTVDAITDEDILDGALDDKLVAIFAYSPSMAAEIETKAIEFINNGGTVFAFYGVPEGLAQALGFRDTGYLRQTDAQEFAIVKFEPDAVEGLPDEMAQHSWNVDIPEPTREDAKVIGWWESPDGERHGAAMVLSDSGAYLGHVLTTADAARKGQAMTALIGHFVPDIWQSKAEKLIAAAGRVGPYTTLDELRQGMADVGKANGPMTRGDNALAAAEQAFDAGEFMAACEDAENAQQAFRRAYFVGQTPKDGEFRAMWEHSGYGAYPGEGWAKSLDILKANGFNAIIPNMWWAGLARYDSEYLPHAPQVEDYGDAIADCVEAAHARGIQVHAWKVNWNLSNAPQEFVDELRAQGRTMVDFEGNPVDWLCPSHPDNFQLELDTMVEVAEKYDVDGVHFDYIRYLGESVCYCDGCRERFQADTGAKVTDWPMECYKGDLMQAYRDWRCEQITRLVKATSQQVRAIKPNCKISAAVFSNYPSTKKSIGQDWLLWVKEGYLDFVCPMDYTDSDIGFGNTVARQAEQIDGMCPLYPGIGASAPGISADHVVNQIALSREHGAQGFTIFQLSKTTAEDHVPACGLGVLSKPTEIADE